MASADIGQTREVGEVVGFECCIDDGTREVCHGGVEVGRLIGFVVEEFEGVFAECLRHTVSAGANAVRKFGPGSGAPGVVEHDSQIAHGSRGVRLEQFADRSQAEMVSSLGEDAEAESRRMTR